MTEISSPSTRPRPWWVWGNILGLNAVVAALVWLPLFSYAAGTKMRARGFLFPPEYLLLGCAVWFVYAADRILDGRMRGGPRSDRHVFAARHWPWLIAAMLTAAGVCGWLLYSHVSEIVLMWGLKFTIVTAIYFLVTWLSRQSWGGLTAAGSLGGVMAMSFMHNPGGLMWAEAWRAVMSGFLITVIYQCVRHPAAPAAWVLPRKLFGGMLFAAGTALIPYASIERWPQLSTDPVVLLFGIVCALNSLGIRLWERTEQNFEHAMLNRLYPWLVLTAGLGAFMEWRVADPWSRPLLLACSLTALLLLPLHFLRHLSPGVRTALADAAVILPGAVILAVGLK